MSGSAPAPSFLHEATEASEQALVPGVAPLTWHDRLSLRAAAPLEAPGPQRPLAIGQFDLAARAQLELFGPGGSLAPASGVADPSREPGRVFASASLPASAPHADDARARPARKARSSRPRTPRAGEPHPRKE